MALTDFSFMRVIVMNRLTFTSNVRIKKPNSGSTPPGCRIVEGSAEWRSTVYKNWLKKIKNIY
jgi:hypothetical protein